MANCYECLHYEACSDVGDAGFSYLKDGEEKCDHFKNKADFVEVVRCKDCLYASEFDKHCELNRNAYRHCELWKGDETRNVWHKYRKYYKDYSIVEPDDFCSGGVRKEK